MKRNNCIYCICRFAQADEEHVLQNHLGARWDDPSIVCNSCQSSFSTTIDKALEKGLERIRNILGTEGGRGEKGPILRSIPVSTGEIIDLTPGGRPRLNSP